VHRTRTPPSSHDIIDEGLTLDASAGRAQVGHSIFPPCSGCSSVWVHFEQKEWPHGGATGSTITLLQTGHSDRRGGSAVAGSAAASPSATCVRGATV